MFCWISIIQGLGLSSTQQFFVHLCKTLLSTQIKLLDIEYPIEWNDEAINPQNGISSTTRVLCGVCVCVCVCVRAHVCVYVTHTPQLREMILQIKKKKCYTVNAEAVKKSATCMYMCVTSYKTRA